MVIMASSIASVHILLALTESHNMATIIIGWQGHTALIYCVLLWYWTSKLWSIDSCQNKASTDQYHVTILQAQVYCSQGHIFLSWPLTKCCFSTGSRAHVGLTCWKQGRLVRKWFNSNPGLKVNQIITFFLYNFFLLPCFLYTMIL